MCNPFNLLIMENSIFCRKRSRFDFVDPVEDLVNLFPETDDEGNVKYVPKPLVPESQADDFSVSVNAVYRNNQLVRARLNTDNVDLFNQINKVM